MKKLIAGAAIAIVSLSGAVSAQDTTPAYVKYNKQYAALPGFINKVVPDPDRSRNPYDVAVERDVCEGNKVVSARWRDDVVLAVKCPAGVFGGAAAGGALPGALTGTALTTGAAVGLVAVVTVLVIASGGDGDGTTTTTSGTN